MRSWLQSSWLWPAWFQTIGYQLAPQKPVCNACDHTLCHFPDIWTMKTFQAAFPGSMKPGESLSRHLTGTWDCGGMSVSGVGSPHNIGCGSQPSVLPAAWHCPPGCLTPPCSFVSPGCLADSRYWWISSWPGCLLLHPLTHPGLKFAGDDFILTVVGSLLLEKYYSTQLE